MPGGQECQAEMLGYVEDGERFKGYLSQEGLMAFSRGDDPAARIVAEAVLRINESKPVVTVQECNEAFDVLVDWEINEQSDRSPAEKAFIASLSEAPGPTSGMEMSM